MAGNRPNKTLRTSAYWIIGTYTLVACGITASLAFVVHNKVVVFSISRQLALILVAIVAGALLWAEGQHRNKAVFTLFVILGCQQILDIAYYFVPGILFADNRFAGVQYYQYVAGGLGLFVQSVCVAGTGILMNTKIPTIKALLMVSAFCLLSLVSFMYPMIINPRYLYTTADITDFRIVDRAWMEAFNEEKQTPTAEALAGRISLSRWEGNSRIGELSPREKVERVREIEPYLFGNNYNMLVYKPMNEAWWQMNLACAVFLLVLLAFWFIGETPSGVYFDRISVVLFCFSVFEVFHFYTYANLKDYNAYLNYYNTGAFLSLLTVAGLVVLFVQRLGFVLSHEGQYYESRLQATPIRVARWRDGVDEFIIRKFFSQNPYRRRFLTKTPPPTA